MRAAESVDWPEIKIAFQGGVVRPAENREHARGGLAFAARENHERPRHLPFAVFFLAVVHPGEERPDDGRGIELRRARVGVKRDAGAEFFRVVRADAVVLLEMQRPEIKRALVAANGFDVAKAVRVERDDFMLGAGQRPDVPAVHSVAVADIAKRIKIIVRDDILLPRLAVNREHHKWISSRDSRFFSVP